MFSALPLKAQQNLDREIKDIVEPLVASISNQPVKNVAISDFTLLDGTPTELGKYLAEEFSLSLINAKKSFVVIDRSRVTALLKENNLDGLGLIDPNTIAKLGKMKGIDALIAGTLTSTGNTIRLIVKVWNLESQGLVAGNKGDISKTPFIMELEGKVVSAGTTVVTPQPPTKQTPITTFKKGNLLFELLDCKQIGQNVECNLLVSCEDKDIGFTLFGGGKNSRILDAVGGGEYYSNNLQVADKSDDKRIDKSIIAGYPVKVKIVFTSVSKRVDMISKLEIKSGINLSWFTAEMRNIPVKH